MINLDSEALVSIVAMSMWTGLLNCAGHDSKILSEAAEAPQLWEGAILERFHAESLEQQGSDKLKTKAVGEDISQPLVECGFLISSINRIPSRRLAEIKILGRLQDSVISQTTITMLALLENITDKQYFQAWTILSTIFFFVSYCHWLGHCVSPPGGMWCRPIYGLSTCAFS